MAVAIARAEATKEEAVTTSATATIGEGTVTDSNVGQPCASGKLIHIKLIGTFPHIVHGGVTGIPYEDVSAVLMTAGLESGTVCLISVQTGHTTPDPGAVLLFTN